MVASSAATPAIVTLNTPSVLLFLIGLVLTVILLVLNVKGAILIGIVATTILGIPMGVVDLSGISFTQGISDSFTQLGTTFGAAFTQGFPALFSDAARLPLVLMTIFAFSLSDTFDTIGTFIGTGRRSGIFSEEDEATMASSSGFNPKWIKPCLPIPSPRLWAPSSARPTPLRS